jgi:hypothetical protein
MRAPTGSTSTAEARCRTGPVLGNEIPRPRIHADEQVLTKEAGRCLQEKETGISRCSES